MKKTTLYFLLSIFIACNNDEATPETEVEVTGTPVTVTTISNGPMEEYIELNATSAFLQKWIVRSNITGYLEKGNVQLNKQVKAGEVLYSVKTKEAQSIGNTIDILDSSLKFTGLNTIRATQTGFLSEIDHQLGDYVQDGEQLAVITDTKSFVFLLDLPYELRPLIQGKKTLDMLLPDGEKLTGIINGTMPAVDPVSQTQRVILKVNAHHSIPENLIAKVKLVKSSKPTTLSLPKTALLTNETQAEFWVMKMINDSIAAKVPVKKGIETSDRVEILAPRFTANDRILVTGNYGLGDTAKVKISQ